jgi:hypothetical protein
MSYVYNDNAAHRAALLAAEQTYQSAIATATTQAQFDAADIVRLRASIASAKANGCGLEPFVTALKGNHGLNT